MSEVHVSEEADDPTVASAVCDAETSGAAWRGDGVPTPLPTTSSCSSAAMTIVGSPSPERAAQTPAAMAAIEQHGRDPRSSGATWGLLGPTRRASLVRLAPGLEVPGTRYRIEHILGAGSFGTVYRVHHVDLGRDAVVKVLNVSSDVNHSLAETFRNEARAASTIGSDYIVDVFDLSELPDGRPMFVMEYLDGASLDTQLREPMAPARVIGILRQLCKGLDAAHAAGIVHRDVKPENVLLHTRGGQRDAVKILDFGIAAALGDSPRVAAGTPYYMAPEVAAADEFDHRADIYSVGCTAYELLSGAPPFTEGDPEEVLDQHVSAPVPEITHRCEGASPAPALERVVMRCLAKDPDDRYADMVDLEAAICEAQIEDGLRTDWDTLPLPETAPARLEAIRAGMPGARWVDPRRLAAMIAVSVGVFGLALAALVMFANPLHRAPDRVEQLLLAAQEAAAEHYFVYPPADKPGAATAYSRVLELESLQGVVEGDVEERAAELRYRFAATLVRLGDYYWGRPGGRPFARDYYLQAQVFLPEHPYALERSGATRGELADFRARAERRHFSGAELDAVRPLVALAGASEHGRPDKQRARVEQAIGSSDAKPRSSKAALERLSRPMRTEAP